MVRITLLIMMVLHGLIHLMGGMNELGLAEIEGVAETLFLIPSGIQFVLGFVWIGAVILFLVSAFGLITKKKWWKKLTIVSVVISQMLVMIWLPAAKGGTIPNVLIIILILIISRRDNPIDATKNVKINH